jgi:hypothetical protein
LHLFHGAPWRKFIRVKIPALSAIVSGYAQPRAISVTLAINKGRANALAPTHARINARFAMKFARTPPHTPAAMLTRRVPLTKFVSRVLPNFVRGTRRVNLAAGVCGGCRANFIANHSVYAGTCGREPVGTLLVYAMRDRIARGCA